MNRSWTFGAEIQQNLILWISQRFFSVLGINFKPDLKGGKVLQKFFIFQHVQEQLTTFPLSLSVSGPAYFCEQGSWSHAGIFHNPHPQTPTSKYYRQSITESYQFYLLSTCGNNLLLCCNANLGTITSPPHSPHPPSTTTASQLLSLHQPEPSSPVHSVYCSQRILFEM